MSKRVAQASSRLTDQNLPIAAGRPLLVFSWLNQTIAQHYNKELGVHPPIVSRIFHELALGHNGFMQARKISDIPFPFPHAQLSNMILVLFAVTLPFMVARAFTPLPEDKGGWSTWWLSAVSSGLLASVCSVTFFSLSEVARDLEGVRVCLCVPL